MKESNKIVLKGQTYAAPQTESVEITNQGVLCGSGGGAATSKSVGIGVKSGGF